MSFRSVWTKCQDGEFRNRLRVAVCEQCRWTLQMTQAAWPGGITAGRFAAMQDLARVLRSQLTTEDAITRIGLYALLPFGSWTTAQPPGAFDPDDDASLQAKVSAVFAELANATLPA